MKTKSRLLQSLSLLAHEQPRAWLEISLLLIIAFLSIKFVYSIDYEGMNLVLPLGIVLGIFAEYKFDLETLYVYGFIALMVISFILMLLLIPLSNTIFESSFVLVSTVVLVITATIAMQWLFKNWICRYWGKLWGTIFSAITLSLGVILPSLLSETT